MAQNYIKRHSLFEKRDALIQELKNKFEGMKNLALSNLGIGESLYQKYYTAGLEQINFKHLNGPDDLKAYLKDCISFNSQSEKIIEETLTPLGCECISDCPKTYYLSIIEEDERLVNDVVSNPTDHFTHYYYGNAYQAYVVSSILPINEWRRSTSKTYSKGLFAILAGIILLIVDILVFNKVPYAFWILMIPSLICTFGGALVVYRHEKNLKTEYNTYARELQAKLKIVKEEIDTLEKAKVTLEQHLSLYMALKEPCESLSKKLLKLIQKYHSNSLLKFPKLRYLITNRSSIPFVVDSLNNGKAETLKEAIKLYESEQKIEEIRLSILNESERRLNEIQKSIKAATLEFDNESERRLNEIKKTIEAATLKLER